MIGFIIYMAKPPDIKLNSNLMTEFGNQPEQCLYPGALYPDVSITQRGKDLASSFYITCFKDVSMCKGKFLSSSLL